MYDSNKWKFGKILNRKGKLHYEVNEDWSKHHRHVAQLIKTACKSDNDNLTILDNYWLKQRPLQKIPPLLNPATQQPETKAIAQATTGAKEIDTFTNPEPGKTQNIIPEMEIRPVVIGPTRDQ